MKTTKFFMAAALSCFLIFSGAAAQAYPDMVGTWKATNEAVVIGNPKHYKTSPDTATPRFVGADLTVTIRQQEGRRLAGTVATADYSEAFLGVLWRDGKSLRGVDENGFIEARISDPNTMEWCYTHTGATMVAGCMVLTRR